MSQIKKKKIVTVKCIFAVDTTNIKHPLVTREAFKKAKHTMRKFTKFVYPLETNYHHLRLKHCGGKARTVVKPVKRS